MLWHTDSRLLLHPFPVHRNIEPWSATLRRQPSNGVLVVVGPWRDDHEESQCCAAEACPESVGYVLGDETDDKGKELAHGQCRACKRENTGGTHADGREHQIGEELC